MIEREIEIQGDKLKVTAEGEDAEEMMNAFLEFAKENL